MKKMIALFLSLAMVFALTACGSQQTDTAKPDSSEPASEAAGVPAEDLTEPEETTAAETDGDESTESAGGRTLVVYYSATGHTGAVAKTIADTTGGDLFELEPVEPYSDADLNWTDQNSRVCLEHDNEEQRNVALTASTVENWAQYDTVFIGYPIWWGIAAWPVNEFITGNDFTGKTVIPFATSSSSGLGESVNLLSEMAGTGDWQEGMRFNSGVSAEDVSAWVNGLGLNN